ncbi:LppU/SCO3897 family protein [Actinophytocola oryzae]|uniref:Uncharacterized protein n=1 Tax=Actinophytocola oryzae TaxID=502181 RepID=A0A4R7UZ94_9PSEU|nr:hypothetical protein [Actinophytocola oryzae]TDV41860.1 hypothetical protein CLV71_119182 [Actinophytocola oryzae]
MNSPNYPPPGGQGPYGPPQGGQPYGQQRPPQTPPGGQPYGAPPPQGQQFNGPPPQGQPFGNGQGGPGGPAGGGFGPPGGPGGAPPASYPTPPPPPPSAKPNKTALYIKIGIAVVVVAIAGFFVIKNWGTAPSSSNVGDCIKVNEASISNADVDKVDCGDPGASYKVGATFDDASKDCPGGDKSAYVGYTETGGRGSDLLLCLILNAKVGDCYVAGDQVDTKVDCADAKATFKVTQLLQTADESGCPQDSLSAYVYPEPKPGLVQCLGDPKGAAAGS